MKTGMPEYIGREVAPMTAFEIISIFIGILALLMLELLRNDGHHDQDGYDMVMMILDFCKEARSISEIMEKFAFDSRTSFRRKYLNKLVKEGRLKMTLPDKPKSKNQKYYS